MIATPGFMNESKSAGASSQPKGGVLVDVPGMTAFVAIIDAGSYTGAARRLGTSKSVLSRRITDIEVQLGARLIDRSTARVSPTEVGAVYYAKCVRILEAIEAANDFAASFNGGLRGVLRVSAPRFYCARVIAPLLNEFVSRYEEIKVELEVDEQEASLQETGFDVAVRIGRLPDSRMHAKSIGTSRVWLCASPEYLKASGNVEDIADLEQRHGLIHASNAVQSGWSLCVDGSHRVARVRERVRSACYFQLLEAARAGLGIAMLPDYLIEDAIKGGELMLVLPAYAPPPRPISIVYPPGRKVSQKVQALISYLSKNTRANYDATLALSGGAG